METALLNRPAAISARRRELEAVLRSEQAKLANGDADAAAKIRAVRDEQALLADECAGMEENQRREMQARDAEERAADRRLRKAAVKEANAIEKERRENAVKRSRLAKELAKAELHDRTLVTRTLSVIAPFVSVAELRHELVIGTGFNDPQVLLARQLAAEGVFIPGLERLAARSCVDQRDLLGWHDLRGAHVQRVIEEVLPDEDDVRR